MPKVKTNSGAKKRFALTGTGKIKRKHKVGPFSQDEGADTSALQDTSPWTKEDGSLAWGTYECRRAY